MKEQERAKKSKAYGEKKYNEDLMTLRSRQDQGSATSKKKNDDLNNSRNEIFEKIRSNKPSVRILPSFDIIPTQKYGAVLSIQNGSIKYKNSKKNILENVTLILAAGEKLFLKGKNGSGKSTLLKGIMQKKFREKCV